MSRVLVIGSGVAGLTTALALHEMPDVEVTVVTKSSIDKSNTAWAQGGVAVVTDPADSVASHVSDTLIAGAGLSATRSVEVLCAEGPKAIYDMIDAGVEFDRKDGELARGLEAAHSFARILHGDGDATGAVIASGLIAAVRAANIEVLENVFVADLVLDGSIVTGAKFLDGSVLEADAVILATGGAGQIFPYTTNPSVATADGIALGLRAGAVAADLEFYQFHPTSLASGKNPLISEAVRGEGGHLIDESGARFMFEIHPDGELAPRDVVARGIADQMRKQGGVPARLDVRHLGAEFLSKRFPNIEATLTKLGWDWATTPVPVTPAAHYFMGGIRVDLEGRTSVPGLYAVGEVACNGLHGANRLASNSLLEGAVYAHRVAAAARADVRDGLRAGNAVDELWDVPTVLTIDGGVEAFLRTDLQQLMWDAVGLSRDDTQLGAASERLAQWHAPEVSDVKSAEDANLLLLARAMVQSARARSTSLGAHWRSDSLDAEPGAVPLHSTVVLR